MQYERSQAQPVKDKKAKQAKDKQPEKKSPATVIPEPFTCRQEILKISKGKSSQLQISFLPFELGIHKCNIILTDDSDGAGEV